jgi:co-chaperonin GroES (HSP10)
VSADSYTVGFAKQTLEEAFPVLPIPVRPYGGRVVVQIRRLPKRSRSGLILIEDTRDTAKWNTQVGKLVAIGPLAFRNRETGEPWPEGIWAALGQYVRVPRWDGDRIEVMLKGEDDPVIFVTFNDAQLIGEINGDPLEQLIYEL